ncbi:DUF6223 family protein [Actinomadura sp. NPDC047616]|uniref:DUF6223 family protein n=1 Tax=Actinomadura sp. NPDC047616 TaxID=3155914 RepID=UPI0033DA7013
MSVRHLLAAAATALLSGIVLATPAAAHVSAEPAAAGAYDLSPGRLGAIVAALLGLVSVVIGGLVLARPTGRGRSRANMALAAGLIGMALGGVVVATADGGLGTGNGLGGGIVALTLGLIGTALSALSLTRSRQTN